MRVIAGSARRLLLKTVPGMETRPTSDRIKETLFNMLQPYLPDCCFLDLFAGSGGIGIEALSRGAESAVFVESSADAVKCIRGNLDTTGFSGRASCYRMDALAAVDTLGKDGKKFDIIFMDPPYGMGLEEKILKKLSSAQLLKPGAMIIIEAALGTEFSYACGYGYTIEKEKRYKTNKHVFLK